MTDSHSSACTERNGHLKLDVDIRHKVLSISAATIDRLLRKLRGRTARRSLSEISAYGVSVLVKSV